MRTSITAGFLWRAARLTWPSSAASGHSGPRRMPPVMDHCRFLRALALVGLLWQLIDDLFYFFEQRQYIKSDSRSLDDRKSDARSGACSYYPFTSRQRQHLRGSGEELWEAESEMRVEQRSASGSLAFVRYPMLLALAADTSSGPDEQAFESESKSKNKAKKPPGKKKDGAGKKNKGEMEAPATCTAELQFTPGEAAMDVKLDYCVEHAQYTCCRRPHANRVKSKMNEHAVSMMRSGQCATMTRQMLCSQCDGDIGTGLLSAGGVMHICPVLCDAWFSSCKDEFWLSRGGGELVPCNNDVGCRPLHELAGDSQDFCENAFSKFHAIEVANPADEPDLCYDGVPASRTKKGDKWPPPSRTSSPGEMPSGNIFVRTHQMMYREFRKFCSAFLRSVVAPYGHYLLAIFFVLGSLILHLDSRQGYPLLYGMLGTFGILTVNRKPRGRGTTKDTGPSAMLCNHVKGVKEREGNGSVYLDEERYVEDEEYRAYIDKLIEQQDVRNRERRGAPEPDGRVMLLPSGGAVLSDRDGTSAAEEPSSSSSSGSNSSSGAGKSAAASASPKSGLETAPTAARQRGGDNIAAA
ncbi:unnamed protein product [Amoebophrya sp. A25]|nr:unnamed protein product [Amoebophrya sp. A25]|eukprot:GSA25T00001715001.1